MGFFKAVTLIALWILLSFFWVSLGQSQLKRCGSYGQLDGWLKPYPLLGSWYHFYVDRKECEANSGEFFKTLASSEQLSIKLNQAKVAFDQFYVPIYNMLSLDWKKVGPEDFQKIQSDLSTIDHSLKKAVFDMNAADRDYFRAVVLLDLPKEFVWNESRGFKANPATLSRRLNYGPEASRPSRIDSREIASPPIEKVYLH